MLVIMRYSMRSCMLFYERKISSRATETGSTQISAFEKRTDGARESGLMGVEYGIQEKATFSPLLFIRLRSASTRAEHAHYYCAVAAFFANKSISRARMGDTHVFAYAMRLYSRVGIGNIYSIRLKNSFVTACC